MKKLPALLYHLAPIIPFALGYVWIGVSAILLVGLAYIKVQKLRMIRDEELRKFGRRDEGISKAIVFWERLTFLPER